jgi:hypothetical protein
MASASPRSVAAATPEDFSTEVNNFVGKLKELFKIQKALHTAKAQKQGGLDWKGSHLKSTDVTALQNQLLREVKGFKKLYRAGFNRRRGAGNRKGGPNSGFRLPIALKQELIDFLNAANLGSLGGNKLQVYLPFLNNSPGNPLYGVASRAVLTPLFSLYAELNNLSDRAMYNQQRAATPEYKNRQLLGADETMRRFLGQTFANITRKSAAKLASEGHGDLQPKPEGGKRRKRHYYRDFVINPATGKKERGKSHMIWNDFYHVFSPDNFTYGNFQNIISELVYSNNKDSKTSTPLPASDPRTAYVGKVGEQYAAAYQQAILAGTSPMDAGLSITGTANVDQLFQRSPELGVRVNLDAAFQIVKQALEQYAAAHPSASKKSKKR